MFCETEWLRLLFLLADTQQWLNDMGSNLFSQLPVENKKKILRKTYHLSVTALAHIIEKHYYKIPRHPGAGKFHIDVPGILALIRDAADTATASIPGSANLQRIHNTGQSIGFDKTNKPATAICIITGPGGNIITAFPVSGTGLP